MVVTAKITSKGQVTIPKKIRDLLHSNVIAFRVVKGEVRITPVESVGGALKKYAKKHKKSFKQIRNRVWTEVAGDKA